MKQVFVQGDQEWEEMFCKNALVQTRGEGLNEEQRFLETVKPEYSHNLLVDS